MTITRKINGREVSYYKSDNLAGKGFINYRDEFTLELCPSCEKDNHEMNIIHGLCAWCGFDANEEPLTIKK